MAYHKRGREVTRKNHALELRVLLLLGQEGQNHENDVQEHKHTCKGAWLVHKAKALGHVDDIARASKSKLPKPRVTGRKPPKRPHSRLPPAACGHGGAIMQ